jgi:hypothetical protein
MQAGRQADFAGDDLSACVSISCRSDSCAVSPDLLIRIDWTHDAAVLGEFLDCCGEGFGREVWIEFLKSGFL